MSHLFINPLPLLRRLLSLPLLLLPGAFSSKSLKDSKVPTKENKVCSRTKRTQKGWMMKDSTESVGEPQRRHSHLSIVVCFQLPFAVEFHCDDGSNEEQRAVGKGKEASGAPNYK